MIFTIFTIIVFIAEVIVGFSVVKKIIDFDKLILEFDSELENSKSSIMEIAVLSKKISFQMIELSNDFADRIKKERENMIINQLNKIVLAFVLYRINIKSIRKFRKSKLGKTLAKGFSILQNMV